MTAEGALRDTVGRCIFDASGAPRAAARRRARVPAGRQPTYPGDPAEHARWGCEAGL